MKEMTNYILLKKINWIMVLMSMIPLYGYLIVYLTFLENQNAG